jgi:hypothetical protein
VVMCASRRATRPASSFMVMGFFFMGRIVHAPYTEVNPDISVDIFIGTY